MKKTVLDLSTYNSAFSFSASFFISDIRQFGIQHLGSVINHLLLWILFDIYIDKYIFYIPCYLLVESKAAHTSKAN